MAAPLFGNRVRHTNRSLNQPKGILPCLRIASNRSRLALLPVGKNMTLFFRQSYDTLFPHGQQDALFAILKKRLTITTVFSVPG